METMDQETLITQEDNSRPRSPWTCYGLIVAGIFIIVGLLATILGWDDRLIGGTGQDASDAVITRKFVAQVLGPILLVAGIGCFILVFNVHDKGPCICPWKPCERPTQRRRQPQQDIEEHSQELESTSNSEGDTEEMVT